MHFLLATLLILLWLQKWTNAIPSRSLQLQKHAFDRHVSRDLFLELEELSRLVAISYCVGNTGIQEPFECLSHCSDFEGLTLVKTWSTGIVESSSSGYIVLSNRPWPRRILVIFRGTYSLSDTIHDLMTNKAQYVPYPVDNGDCKNCTVHSGFMESWQETREQILPTIEALRQKYPQYRLVLAGHSLGGAAAGLAALEFKARGWDVEITTFGEPRLGNQAMVHFMDSVFPWNTSESSSKYRRVTHIHDPVPLLPFEEWGWHMHGGEIFISMDALPPDVNDLERCQGDEDERCIEGVSTSGRKTLRRFLATMKPPQQDLSTDPGFKIPSAGEIWHSLFAHREYFWRIGLCFDPQWRDYPKHDRLWLDL